MDSVRARVSNCGRGHLSQIFILSLTCPSQHGVDVVLIVLVVDDHQPVCTVVAVVGVAATTTTTAASVCAAALASNAATVQYPVTATVLLLAPGPPTGSARTRICAIVRCLINEVIILKGNVLEH